MTLHKDITSKESSSELLIATGSGKLEEVKRIWAIQSNKGDVTLEDIAAKAAIQNQVGVLEWCFASGLSMPSHSFNNKVYNSACWSESPAIFQVLLDHGMDINQHETETCGDALCHAAEQGNAEFAKWLLDHGQDPNIRRTPYPGDLDVITYAIAGRNPSLDILHLMHQSNADFMVSHPVIAAAEVGNIKALVLCLDYGVDIEDVGNWGRVGSSFEVGTALYRACRHGQTEAVRVLLERGANGNARDTSGVSCIEIAQQRQYWDILDMLKSKGFNEPQV